MKSYCTNCNRQTNQEVLFEKDSDIFEPETGWWEDSKYQVIKCMGCDEISFRKLYNNIALQQSADQDTTEQMLYPERGAHSRPIKPYRGLPFNIQVIYRETIDSYNSNLRLLCGAGLRAIVEAICIDKSITGGMIITKTGLEKNSKQLDGKIAGLASNGYITKENSEVLHELRFLGNEAIHKLTQPTTEELGIAIDIIELVIDNIYFFKKKGIDLKKIRDKRIK